MLRIALLSVSASAYADPTGCSSASDAFCESMVGPGSVCDALAEICTQSGVACACQTGDYGSSTSAVAERRLAISANSTVPPTSPTVTTTLTATTKPVITTSTMPSTTTSVTRASTASTISPSTKASTTIMNTTTTIKASSSTITTTVKPSNSTITTTAKPSNSTITTTTTTTTKATTISTSTTKATTVIPNTTKATTVTSTTTKATTVTPTSTRATTVTTTSPTPTTTKPTSISSIATTALTTKLPTTNIGNPLSGCASPAQSSEPIFLWLEWPTLAQTNAAWNSYYSGLLSFIQSNCAMLSVTRLIIRFILPVFPLNVAQGAWWPPAASSLYTQLLKPLGSRNIELYAYPYVMEDYNQQQWAAFSPDKTNVIRGVFEFTKQWNTFLTSVGSVSKFQGVVFDYEEFNRNNPIVLAQVQGMGPLKTEYGFKTGIALGYNSFSHMTMWDSVMDQFYLEFYDFYYVPDINRTPQSPFLLYKNQPQVLATFILKTVLGGLSENISKYGPKVQVMWSNQNINVNCQYPLNNKTCGPNYEFGVWSASAFNQFLAAFRQASPNLGSKPQGIFQYSFTPTDWFVTAPAVNGR